jgi:hypothetical protein
MRYRIIDVYFPGTVADKIHSRGIDEDMVLRALMADADLGDLEPLVADERETREGHPDCRFLARDPVSGRYLELGMVIEPGGLVRCYHAMDMRAAERKRFTKGRR